jgi:hypothetical protein
MPQAQGSPSVLPFDPLLNSLPKQPLTELPAKRRRTGEYATALDAVKLAVGLVEDEFGLRATASEGFPPDITSSHIRTSVSRYEDEISAASERSVCCCCGRFIAAEISMRFMMRPISFYHHNVPSIIAAITRTLGTSARSVTQQLVVAVFQSSPLRPSST